MDQFLINLLNDKHQNNIIERRILMMSDDETSLLIIEKNPSLTITWQVVQAQDFSHACSMDMPLESAALRIVSPSEAST